MKKTYALKRLLEHGPMTRADIIDCTRWDQRTVCRVIQQCLFTKTIQVTGAIKVQGKYKLAYQYEAV